MFLILRESQWVCRRDRQTDRQTYGRTPDRYIALSVGFPATLPVIIDDRFRHSSACDGRQFVIVRRRRDSTTPLTCRCTPFVK